MLSKKLVVKLDIPDIEQAVKKWVEENEGEEVIEVEVKSDKLGGIDCTLICKNHETKVTKKRKSEPSPKVSCSRSGGF